MVIERIDSPEDVKRLRRDEIDVLASEIRELLVRTCAVNGGHLAPNLGVVELTLALHRVLDLPVDRLVWDVSHQTYVHKILTGRRERFGTIRKGGGISGFAMRSESPYDPFGAGHASTSVAAALGMGGTPMAIDQGFAKKDYKDMVAAAVACQGVVLISWQHQDIPWVDEKGKPGISQRILLETGRVGNPFNIPQSWPSGPAGARYDLVWVFDRPSGSGPITGFTLFAQMLLAGDAPAPGLS